MKDIIKNILESGEQMEFPTHIPGFGISSPILVMYLNEYAHYVRGDRKWGKQNTLEMLNYAEYLMVRNGVNYFIMNQYISLVSSVHNPRLVWIQRSDSGENAIGVNPKKCIPLCVEASYNEGLRLVLWFSESTHNSHFAGKYKEYYNLINSADDIRVISDNEFQQKVNEYASKISPGLKL